MIKQTSISHLLIAGPIVVALLFSVLPKAQTSHNPEEALRNVISQQRHTTSSHESAQGENPYAVYFDTQIPTYLDEAGIVGAVVTVVQDGNVAFMNGYGYADLELQIEMDPKETVMHIGSAGKTFTAVAVMQLVEQGLIDLEADVNAYLDFQIPATYPQPITVWHLLTHTSGFEAHNMGIIVVDPEHVPTSQDYVIRNLPKRIYPPGEVIGYSNYGLALLGYVVEQVSGLSLSDYLDSMVLHPLDMEHSSTQIVPPEWMRADMARGYHGGVAQPDEYIASFGAAPVRASAADMAAYLTALLEGGTFEDRQILAPETMLNMQTRQFSSDTRVNGIGLGFYEMSCNDKRIVGHLGTTTNFHTLIFMLPEENLGVFVSFNSVEALGIMPSGIVLRDFMDHFYPHQVTFLEPPQDFDSRADQYTGLYFLNNQFGQHTTEKVLFLLNTVRIRAPGDNTLKMTIGGNTRTYVEIASDTFQRQGDDELLIFYRNVTGNVDRASLSSRAVFTLERRPWYETPELTFGILIGVGLIFLISLITSLFLPHLSNPGSNPSIMNTLGKWSALWIPVLNLTFLIGFTLLLPGVVRGDAVLRMKIVLLLPILASVLVLVLSAVMTMNWLLGHSTLFSQLHYSLITLAGMFFAMMLQLWNLLGWRL